MFTLRKTVIATVAAFATMVFAATSFPAPVKADPPSWSSSHGHGAKQSKKHWEKYKAPRRYVYRRQYRKPYFNNRSYGQWRPRYRRYPNVVFGNSGNTLFGGLIGGALGAITGSQFGKGDGRTAAIIGGSVLGAIIGGNIGQSMNGADHYQARRSLERNRTIAWNNARTGARYTVKPTRTYRNSRNQYCREYTTWGFIGGYEEKMYGTACRQPDGNWTSVN